MRYLTLFYNQLVFVLLTYRYGNPPKVQTLEITHTVQKSTSSTCQRGRTRYVYAQVKVFYFGCETYIVVKHHNLQLKSGYESAT